MHEICSRLHTCLLDYMSTGSNLIQVYLDLKIAFFDLKITRFTQKLMTWEDKHCSTSALLQEDPSTILLYLHCIPELVEKCIDKKQWPDIKMPLVERVPLKHICLLTKPSTSSDIVAFKTIITSTMTDDLKDSFNSTLQAYVSLSSNNYYNKHSLKNDKNDPGSSQSSSPLFTAAPHKITLQNKGYITWTTGTKSVCITCGSNPYNYGCPTSGTIQAAIALLQNFFYLFQVTEARIPLSSLQWHQLVLA